MGTLTAQILRLRANGKKLREIAQELGLTLGAVNQRLRAARGVNRKRTRTRQNPSPLSPEVWDNQAWFQEHYGRQQLSIGRLAYLTGRANGTIRKRLNRYSIEVRSQKQSKRASRPTKAWVREHYLRKHWSATDCAQALNISEGTFAEILLECGITQRTVSEQFKAFWKTPESDKRRGQLKSACKKAWADPKKRQEASKRTTNLISNGRCHSKHIEYRGVRFRSKLECETAKAFDNAGLEWDYEATIIQYRRQGRQKRFVVDFTLPGILIECKNPYLMRKEKAKLNALEKYCKRRSLLFFIIQRPAEIVQTIEACQN